MSESTDFTKLKVTELKALCKERGLPVSGTKQELIQRINGEPSAKPEKSKSTKAKKTTNTLERPVFTKYLQNLERVPIIIKRNIHGQFEHFETGLVFNSEKRVIGVQTPSGEIESLGVSDLENVYKYHFELEPGTKIKDKVSNPILEDDSLKQKRVDELIDLIENTQEA
jgi:hypothetical protein